MRRTRGHRGPRIWKGAAGAFLFAPAWVLIRVDAYSTPSRAARLLTEHDHGLLLGERRRL